MTIIGFDNTVTREYWVDQATNVWCWAAGLEMVFKIHGVHLSQEYIAGATHGLQNGKAIIRGGKVEEITQWLNRRIDLEDGHHMIFKSTHYAPLPDAAVFKEAVRVRPVVMWKQVTPQYGHILICTGVTIANSTAGNIQGFHVLDPGTPSNTYYDWTQIGNNIKHSWTIDEVKKSNLPRSG